MLAEIQASLCWQGMKTIGSMGENQREDNHGNPRLYRAQLGSRRSRWLTPDPPATIAAASALEHDGSGEHSCLIPPGTTSTVHIPSSRKEVTAPPNRPSNV